jgi:hypothetical protein
MKFVLTTRFHQSGGDGNEKGLSWFYDRSDALFGRHFR